MVFALVAALATGCAGGSEGNDSEENGAGIAASPNATPSDEDPAVAAYVSMWEDAAVASHTSDADHPRLDDHATGEALTLLKFVMEGHAKDGHVARGGPEHDVEIVDSSEERRELRDCMDQTNWLMHEKNGDLVDQIPGAHGLVEATVELDADEWIVTDLIMHGAGTC